MATDFYEQAIKKYKSKTPAQIRKAFFELADELANRIYFDDKFVYFGPLILSFADGKGSREELSVVNEINFKFDYGHEYMSPDNDPEEMDKFVNGGVHDFVEELSLYSHYDDHGNLQGVMKKYQTMVEYIISFFAIRQYISEEELAFLEKIINKPLTNRGLSYDLRNKEKSVEPLNNKDKMKFLDRSLSRDDAFEAYVAKPPKKSNYKFVNEAKTIADKYGKFYNFMEFLQYSGVFIVTMDGKFTSRSAMLSDGASSVMFNDFRKGFFDNRNDHLSHLKKVYPSVPFKAKQLFDEVYRFAKTVSTPEEAKSYATKGNDGLTLLDLIDIFVFDRLMYTDVGTMEEKKVFVRKLYGDNNGVTTAKEESKPVEKPIEKVKEEKKVAPTKEKKEVKQAPKGEAREVTPVKKVKEEKKVETPKKEEVKKPIQNDEKVQLLYATYKGNPSSRLREDYNVERVELQIKDIPYLNARKKNPDYGFLFDENCRYIKELVLPEGLVHFDVHSDLDGRTCALEKIYFPSTVSVTNVLPQLWKFPNLILVVVKPEKRIQVKFSNTRYIIANVKKKKFDSLFYTYSYGYGDNPFSSGSYGGISYISHFNEEKLIHYGDGYYYLVENEEGVAYRLVKTDSVDDFIIAKSINGIPVKYIDACAFSNVKNDPTENCVYKSGSYSVNGFMSYCFINKLETMAE